MKTENTEQTALTRTLLWVLKHRLAWLGGAVMASFLIVAAVQWLATPSWFATAALYVESGDAIKTNEMLCSRDLIQQALARNPCWLASYRKKGVKGTQHEVPFRLVFPGKGKATGDYTISFTDSLHFQVTMPGAAAPVSGSMDYPVAQGECMIALSRVDSVPPPAPGETYTVHIFSIDEIARRVSGEYYVVQLVPSPSKLTTSILDPDSAFAMDFLSGILHTLINREEDALRHAADTELAALDDQLEFLRIPVDTIPPHEAFARFTHLNMFNQLKSVENEISILHHLRDNMRACDSIPAKVYLVWTPGDLALLMPVDSVYGTLIKGVLNHKGEALAHTNIMQLRAAFPGAERKISTLIAEQEQLQRMSNYGLFTELTRLSAVFELIPNGPEKAVQFSTYLRFEDLVKKRTETLLRRNNVYCGLKVIEQPYATYRGRHIYPTQWLVFIPLIVFWIALFLLVWKSWGKANAVPESTAAETAKG